MIELPFDTVLPTAALFHALRKGDSRIQELFPYPPGDSGGVIRSAVAAAGAEAPRGPLSEAVLKRLAQLQAPPESLQGAARMGEPRSVVVVAGQQPVLFGGPHLVLTKALTAIAVARGIAIEFGIPAVPVFWLASEDHDHGEADHVSVPTPDGGVERLKVPLPGDRSMLSRVPLPAEAAAAHARLVELLPQGPGLELTSEATDPAGCNTWGDWVARTLLRLLGPLGLVVIEPETVRPFALPILEHELEHPGRFFAAVHAREERLEEMGFERPLDLRRRELFFAVEKGRRLPVSVGPEGARIDGGPLVPVREMLERLRTRPGLFSWNVVTRVLAQDMALPVAAQVCGPSEIGYVALASAAHDVLGLRAPALVPRPGITVVDHGVARACEALGVEPAAVIANGLAAFPAPEAHELPPGLGEVRAAAAALPDSAISGVRRRREGVLRSVELYAEALQRDLARKDETSEGRRRRVLSRLRPDDRLQERMLSPLPWIARYGTALLDQWLATVELPELEHAVLVPEDAGEEARRG